MNITKEEWKSISDKDRFEKENCVLILCKGKTFGSFTVKLDKCKCGEGVPIKEQISYKDALNFIATY